MKHNLIIISGWGFDPNIFHDLKTTLSDDFNCTLISPLEDMSHALQAIRRKDSYMVLTWSLGLNYYLKHQTYFNQSDGLIILSGCKAFLKGNNPYGWDEKIIQRMIKKLRRSPQIVMEDFVNRSYHKKAINLPKVFDHPYQLANSLNVLTSLSNSNDLKSIKIPVVIIHGINDQIIHYKNGYLLEELLENSQLIFLDDCGHVPHVEKKDVVIQSIKTLSRRIYDQ